MCYRERRYLMLHGAFEGREFEIRSSDTFVSSRKYSWKLPRFFRPCHHSLQCYQSYRRCFLRWAQSVQIDNIRNLMAMIAAKLFDPLLDDLTALLRPSVVAPPLLWKDSTRCTYPRVHYHHETQAQHIVRRRDLDIRCILERPTAVQEQLLP